jgi:hypothetical protein
VMQTAAQGRVHATSHNMAAKPARSRFFGGTSPLALTDLKQKLYARSGGASCDQAQAFRNVDSEGTT